MRVIALSNSAVAENEITNPSAIIAGRILPVWPTDAPSRIGSTGSVQGAAMVTTPASKARTRLSILSVRRTIPARALRPYACPSFFETLGRGVTPAASRVREASQNRNGSQKQSDPEGGIPSGSLEVLG